MFLALGNSAFAVGLTSTHWVCLLPSRQRQREAQLLCPLLVVLAVPLLVVLAVPLLAQAVQQAQAVLALVVPQALVVLPLLAVVRQAAAPSPLASFPMAALVELQA